MKISKKIINIIMSICMVLSAVSFNAKFAHASENVVDDPVLNKYINFKLGRGSVYADITAADMATINDELVLDGYDDQIQNLNGLQYATNIQALVLRNQSSILDLEKISSLNNLKQLDINNSKIRNVNAIANLKNLEELMMDDIRNENSKRLDNIDFLAGFNSLKRFNASNNDIQDISILASLPALEGVNLIENKIRDFSYLGGKGLTLALISGQYIELDSDEKVMDNPLKKVDGTHPEADGTYFKLSAGKIEIKNFDDVSVNTVIPNSMDHGVAHENIVGGTACSWNLSIKKIEKQNLYATKYQLTVNGGTSLKYEYTENELVTIEAPQKNAQNKDFLRWESADVALTDNSQRVNSFMMPAKNVTLTAVYEEDMQVPLQSISLQVANPKVNKGHTENIQVTYNPTNATNKTIRTWTSSKDDVVKVDNNGKIEALKAGKAVITAISQDGDKQASIEIEVEEVKSSVPSGGGGGGGGGGGSSSPTKREITTSNKTENGKIQLSTSKAQTNEKVEISAMPNKDYKTKNIIVKTKQGRQIQVEKISDNKYRFEMPMEEVEVYPEFEKIQEVKKEIPKQETKKENKKQKVSIKIGSLEVQKTELGNMSVIKTDAAPFIRYGRTMMPLRYAAEALGLEVKWDNMTRTAILKDGKKEIKIPIDTNKIIIDGQEYTADIKPIIQNSRIFLSISNLAKALGLVEGENIIWNQETKEVTIMR